MKRPPPRSTLTAPRFPYPTLFRSAIRAFDRQRHSAAQPLTPVDTASVLAAHDEDPFAGGIGARLSGRYPGCATAAPLRTLVLARGSDTTAREKVVDRKSTRLNSRH